MLRHRDFSKSFLKKYFNVFLITILTINISAAFQRDIPENLLHYDLLKGYNPDVLPLPVKQNETLNIYFSGTITNLVDLNIRQNTISADFAFLLRWHNHQLMWNPTEYGNLKSVVLPKKKVWTPTVVTFPELNPLALEDKVLLWNNGINEVYFSERITKQCIANIDKFPMDSHFCRFDFFLFCRSARVNLAPTTNPYLQDFKSDGGWTVVNMSRGVKQSNGTNSTWIYMHVKRNPKYLTEKLVMPVLILSAVPLLTFVVPMDSGERISFAVTGLLTVIVSFQYIMEQLPQNDSDPWIVEMSKMVITAMVLAVIGSAIHLHLYYKRRSGMVKLITMCWKEFCSRVIRKLLRRKTKIVVQPQCGDNKNFSSLSNESSERGDLWKAKIAYLDHLWLVGNLIFWMYLQSSNINRFL